MRSETPGVGERRKTGSPEEHAGGARHEGRRRPGPRFVTAFLRDGRLRAAPQDGLLSARGYREPASPEERAAGARHEGLS